MSDTGDTAERHPFQWTLGQIREMNLELESACEVPGCGWFGRHDLDALLARFGPDYWLPEDGPGFPCEQCGGRLNFQVAYDHPSAEKPPQDGTQE